MAIVVVAYSVFVRVVTLRERFPRRSYAALTEDRRGAPLRGRQVAPNAYTARGDHRKRPRDFVGMLVEDVVALLTKVTNDRALNPLVTDEVQAASSALG